MWKAYFHVYKLLYKIYEDTTSKVEMKMHSEASPVNTELEPSEVDVSSISAIYVRSFYSDGAIPNKPTCEKEQKKCLKKGAE